MDTHAFLWYALLDPAIPSTICDLVEDDANEVLLSPASYWEIAIKLSIKKLKLEEPIGAFVHRTMLETPITILPILPTHVEQVVTMPLIHRDPFDRLIVAQALAEDATLLSADPLLDQYGVKRIW